MKERVGEQIIKTNGCCTVKRVYYRGELAGGTWINGLTGRESMFVENEIKATHVFSGEKEESGNMSEISKKPVRNKPRANSDGVMTLFDAREYDKRFPLEIVLPNGQIKVLRPQQNNKIIFKAPKKPTP